VSRSLTRIRASSPILRVARAKWVGLFWLEPRPLPILKILLIKLQAHRINGPRKERGPWQEGDGKKEPFI
jgi:hypothetical protein